jgi:hypothetical protein
MFGVTDIYEACNTFFTTTTNICLPTNDSFDWNHTAFTMRSTFFSRAALAASVLGLAAAQVPSDFGSTFDLTLQVSYTGDASEGFKDGSKFTKDREILHTLPTFTSLN